MSDDANTNEDMKIQRADQQVALPFGEHRARVDGETGRCDGRIPVEFRLLVAGGFCAHADLHAGIMAAIGDDGPAIVPPR